MGFIDTLKKDFSVNKNLISRVFILLLRLDIEEIPIIKYIIMPIRLVVINLIYNCEIPKSVKLGQGVRFPHPYNIILHGDVVVGNNVTIYQGVTIASNEFLDNNTPPKICDNVLIGSNSVLVGPITIGNNCIISACSLVSKDIGDDVFFKIKEYENTFNVEEYMMQRISSNDSIECRPYK